MEAAGARVAEQPLELARLEHAEAAGDVDRAIDDPPGAFDRAVLGATILAARSAP